jgi:hypothetical protein
MGIWENLLLCYKGTVYLKPVLNIFSTYSVIYVGCDLRMLNNFHVQGVPYPSLPKKEKPRRVEVYFSSWRIRAGNLFFPFYYNLASLQ